MIVLLIELWVVLLVVIWTISFFHWINRMLWTDHLTTLDYSIFILKTKSSWNMLQSSHLLINNLLYIIEIQLGQRIDLISEVYIERRMLINSSPDIVNHFLLLFHLNPLIKAMGISSRHQNNIVIYEMIGCEIWWVPHSYTTIFVESNKSIIDGESSKVRIELMETD